MLVHPRVTPSIKFAGTCLYTWVERGTVRVKCLAQEHNTMSPARARTQTARSGNERTDHEATVPPSGKVKWVIQGSTDLGNVLVVNVVSIQTSKDLLFILTSLFGLTLVNCSLTYTCGWLLIPEQFGTAAEEFQKCLDLQLKHLQPDDRLIAETYPYLQYLLMLQ